MKRRMYWSLCITSIALVLLTALLTLLSVYRLLLWQARQDLADQHRLIAESINYAIPNEQAYFNMLDKRFNSFRITLISRDGIVQFDSENDPAEMGNHLNRPEIADAFASGTGESVRKSQTMGLDTYYYAAKLDENTVLRVSKQTRSIGAVFVTIIPLMTGILLLVVASSLALSSRLTRRLLRPIEGLAENIENTDNLQGYEELEPFFAKIRQQNHLIHQQVGHLRDERDTIKTITFNMKEGMVLLNLERNILSVNRSALSLLGVKDAVYEGKNILNISRSAELNNCIDHAMSGQSCDVMITRDDRICHIFASPVYNKQEVCGVIVLLMDVTEQQKADKIRRDFSANVSHELKTPLTSISGFAEMIESGMVGSEADVKKFAGRIYREASRLMTLTDDIIRLSRIEEGGKADMEPVELRAVCDTVVSALQFTAEQKGVTLHVAIEDVVVQGNPRMLDELIYNLMDNAIKYNHPDGHVDVTVKREAHFAAITVADTGIGIPKEHQDRIFERFYRVDKSRSKQTGGTGLGLSIVKHIVERHSGTITLESAYNVGTKVTIRLPLVQP
ncbi:ATP-binding protein [Oscillospiraceae bacterium PP1C4]